MQITQADYLVLQGGHKILYEMCESPHSSQLEALTIIQMLTTVLPTF